MFEERTNPKGYKTMKNNEQTTARLPLTQTVKQAWIREEGHP